ncbi:MAG: nitroreductase family protein [Clostridiales bacterium]|nr:nitroreductase family protein [Clostridiales bacterium]
MSTAAFEAFDELVHKRRSYRNFSPDPIPDEDVQKILECGRWAMNGGNAQPWEFIVIKDNATKLEMARMWQAAIRDFKPIELSRLPEFRHPLFSRPDNPDDLPNWKHAPVIIGIIGDRRKMQISVLHPCFIGAEGGDGIGSTFVRDTACVAQNMNFAACALGYGSEWVSLERNVEQKFKRLLGIPDDLELHSLVVVAKPPYEAPPGYRRPLEDYVHYESYNMDLFSTTQDIVEQIMASRKAVRASEAAAYKIKAVGEE